MLFQTRGPAAALKSVAILNFVFYVLTGALLLAAVFLIIRPAFAQSEVGTEPASAPVESIPSVELAPPVDVPDVEPPQAVEPQTVEPATIEPELPSAELEQIEQESVEAARQDAAVTHEDLETKESRILPDSPLYGIKRLGRGIQEFFTFDPVEKAEVKLQHANQELADAARLMAQKPGDEDAMASAVESLEEFQEKVSDLQESAEDLRSERSQGDERVDELVTKVLDNQIKQQKILETVGDSIAEREPSQFGEMMAEKIKKVREEAGAGMMETAVGVVQDAGVLTEHLDDALENQKGSEFRDIKNVEVLKQIEQFVPEKAKEAIRRAQENAFKRFAVRLKEMPEEERARKFENYVERVPGNEISHMEIFDELENVEGMPVEVLEKIESAKDMAARRFKNKIERAGEKIDDPELRMKVQERYFEDLDSDGAPDVERVRMMVEISKRVKFEDKNLAQEIEKRRDESVEKFKQRFDKPDDKAMAEEFRVLSKQMAERPDPTTFQLIKELEEKVKADPQKREFVEQMEREAKAQFIEQAEKGKEEFYARVVSTNPEDIEIFNGLKREFERAPEQFYSMPFDGEGIEKPPRVFENGQFFDRVIEKQAQAITGQMEMIRDPEEFEQFGRKLFGMRPEVLKTLEQNSRNFKETFESKQNFIQEVELKNLRAQEQRFNDEERGRLEAETRQKMSQARTNEERDAFEREYKAGQQELIDQNFARQKQVFEKHISIDPFCDEACRGKERAQVENKLEQQFQERRMESKPLEFENNQPKPAVEFKPMPVFEDGRRDGDWEMKKEDARSSGSFQKLEPKVTEAGRMNGGFDNQNFQPQVKMEFRKDDFENVQEGKIEQKFESKEVFSPAPVQEKIIQQPQIIDYSPKQFNEPQEVKYEAQEVKSFEPVQSSAPEPMFSPKPEPAQAPAPSFESKPMQTEAPAPSFNPAPAPAQLGPAPAPSGQ